jgi:uncharacterized membrane protein YczE
MVAVLEYTGFTWVFENFFQLGVAAINSMIYSLIGQAPYAVPFWLSIIAFGMVVGGVILVWKIPKHLSSLLFSFP